MCDCLQKYIGSAISYYTVQKILTFQGSLVASNDAFLILTNFPRASREIAENSLQLLFDLRSRLFICNKSMDNSRQDEYISLTFQSCLITCLKEVSFPDSESNWFFLFFLPSWRYTCCPSASFSASLCALFISLSCFVA